MAFKVGAIVSKLTLDKSGWNTAVKDVGADQKKMQGMSDKTAAKFKKVGAAMTVAGGAIIGALGAMTKKFVDTGDWIDKMSKRTGIGAEALSELAFAADLSGASLTDVEKSVKRMSGTILDAHSGLETYVRAFDQMGISVDDLMQMDPEQQFLSISEAIASIEDPTIRAALAQDVFGRSGTALLPMMADGAEGLQKMREEARELGIIYTTETAQSAADLKDAQTALKESVKGLSMAFTQHLVPLLTDLVKKITGTVAKVSEWARENPQLAKTIIKIAGGVGALLLVLGPIVMLVPKLVLGAKMLAGGFTALLSPVGLLIGALAALAIGYMKVKEAQDKAEKSTRTAAETEQKLWEKLKQGAEAAGISAREIEKLTGKYGGNIAVMTMAIKRGQEGIELQKGLAEVSKKHAEEIEKQKEEMEKTEPIVMDLTGRFQGYLDTVKEVKDETKTWVDYLKDVGKKTVKEKADRVEELTGYLEGLDIVYKKGLISLKDYVESTNAAKNEIKELSTELTTTTIPAARDLGDVYGQAVSEMTTKTSDFIVETEKKAGEFEGLWKDSFEFVTQSTKDNIKAWIGGYQTLGDTLKNIWTDLKDTFINNLVEMGTSFAKDFIGGMLSTAKEGFGSVAASVKNLGKGVVDTIKGFSPGGIVSGVISGAVGGLVTGLMTGSKMKQQNKFLQEISEHTFTTKELLLGDYKTEIHTTHNLLSGIFGKVESLNPKMDASNRTLRDISKNTKPLSSMISAQKGAVVTSPTLAALHGSISNPEIVMPLNELKALKFETMQQQKKQYQQNINVNIMVKDQLDPHTAQNIVRKQIVPQMLKAIEIDARNKTKMRQILGVQV